jgi:tetratricopeptide (TPR) repeat protein
MAQVRLIPRRSDLRFEGRLRESLVVSIEAAGLSYDAAPGRIVTHPRQHDPQFKAERARRNLTLVAREGDGSGQPSLRCLLATGEACFDLAYRDRAAESFRRAIAVAPHGSTQMLEAYYGLLTCFDGEDAGRQLSVCLKALEVFPLDAQLLCAMGHYLQNQRRLDLAARSFETAARHGQVDPQTWHLAEIDAVAAVCCSLAHQGSGREDEARTILRETLEKRPASHRLVRHLIDVDIRLGRGDEAVEIVDGMALDEEARSALRQAVTGACLAARSEWGPALAKLQSAYLAGCRDPICLRWLAIALLSAGQRAGVEPILRQWQEQEPGNREVQLYLDALRATPPGPTETPPAERPGIPSDRTYRVDAPSSPGGLVVPPSELPRSSTRAPNDRGQRA